MPNNSFVNIIFTPQEIKFMLAAIRSLDPFVSGGELGKSIEGKLIITPESAATNLYEQLKNLSPEVRNQIISVGVGKIGKEPILIVSIYNFSDYNNFRVMEYIPSIYENYPIVIGRIDHPCSK